MRQRMFVDSFSALAPDYMDLSEIVCFDYNLACSD